MVFSSLLMLGLAVLSACEELCEQGASCATGYEANNNLNLLQVGLSVEAGRLLPQNKQNAALGSQALLEKHRSKNDSDVVVPVCGPDSTSSATEDSIKLCEDANYFNDTLLVMHFNFAPDEGVLPFLLEMYSPCFRHIAIVAPESSPDCPQFPIRKCRSCDVKYLENDTNKSWCESDYKQKCIATLLDENPGFGGYLIMDDDVIFKPKRLMSYDKNSWWSVDCPKSRVSNYTFTEPAAEQLTRIPPIWKNWKKPTALNGLISWWEKNATEQMKQKYIDYMGGAWAPQFCDQDFQYIPRSMVQFYRDLANEMPFVWLELFTSMVTHLWHAMGETEFKIPRHDAFWDWDYDGDRGHEGTFIKAQHSDAAIIHPIKLSNHTLQNQVREWLLASPL